MSTTSRKNKKKDKTGVKQNENGPDSISVALPAGTGSTTTLNNVVGADKSMENLATPAATSVVPANETPFKQCINVIEKKLRNLEKRKAKLDEYRTTAQSGGKLNPDQKEAVAKYDVVLQNMDFARDLQKQFQSMSADIEKQAKKQARRELIERQKEEAGRMKEVFRMLHFLETLGNDENRNQLCDNPALSITRENLTQIDEFYSLVNVSGEIEGSVEDYLDSLTGHVMHYLEGADKPVDGVTGATYKQLRGFVQRGSNEALRGAQGAQEGKAVCEEVEGEDVEVGGDKECSPEGEEGHVVNDVNNTGGAAVFTGYPPRSDYQPHAFQGYNDGFVDNESGSAGLIVQPVSSQSSLSATRAT